VLPHAFLFFFLSFHLATFYLTLLTKRGRWKCNSGKCSNDNARKSVRRENYKIPV